MEVSPEGEGSLPFCFREDEDVWHFVVKQYFCNVLHAGGVVTAPDIDCGNFEVLILMIHLVVAGLVVNREVWAGIEEGRGCGGLGGAGGLGTSSCDW